MSHDPSSSLMFTLEEDKTMLLTSWGCVNTWISSMTCTPQSNKASLWRNPDSGHQREMINKLDFLKLKPVRKKEHFYHFNWIIYSINMLYSCGWLILILHFSHWGSLWVNVPAKLHFLVFQGKCSERNINLSNRCKAVRQLEIKACLEYINVR